MKNRKRLLFLTTKRQLNIKITDHRQNLTNLSRNYSDGLGNN